MYYDYGTTTVYEGDVVYQGDKQIATADEYYEQAVQIADSGQQDVTAEDAEWQSFGVFGLVQGDEEEADKVLQLGASKDGVIGGNYYDTLTDNTMPGPSTRNLNASPGPSATTQLLSTKPESVTSRKTN